MVMRKLVMTLAALFVIGLIAQPFVSRFFALLPVKPQPTTLYIDGKKVTESEQQGYFFNGDEHLPAAIEYQGTLYVPLQLVGKHTQQAVGWDTASRTAWLGKPPLSQPAAAETPPSPEQAGTGNRSQTAAKRDSTAAANTPLTASEQREPAAQAAEQALPALFGIKLGDRAEQVTALLGAPARREPSALGYEWWIYNQDPNQYIQVGIAAGKVVDLYSNSPHARIGPVTLGTSYETLRRHYPLKGIVTFSYSGAQVEITNLTGERPLVMVQNSGLIFYLDKHNGKRVTALRMIGPLQLLQGGFYETKWTFRGQSPNFDPPPLSSQARAAVNAAHERQILDLVNAIRHRYKLPRLHWSEKAAQVARQHSRDMKEKQFFDHVSATTGLDPFERLKQAGISYQLAGENIAAGFVDAIEAHESWMNSLGHRRNVLEKGFTHLGVGVYTDYYTQNFLTPQ